MPATIYRYQKTSNLGLLRRYHKMRDRTNALIIKAKKQLEPYIGELDRRAREAHPFVLVHRAVPGKRYCISGWWPDGLHAIGVHEIDLPADAPAGPYLRANLHEFIVTKERLTGR